MYKITLSDGTELKKLKLNGNNYISDSKITDETFADNLDEITISNGETTEVHQDMKLISNRFTGGQSWFVLAKKSQSELEKEALEKELADLWDILLFGGDD